MLLTDIKEIFAVQDVEGDGGNLLDDVVGDQL